MADTPILPPPDANALTAVTPPPGGTVAAPPPVVVQPPALDVAPPATPSWDEVAAAHPQAAADMQRLRSDMQRLHDKQMAEARATRPAPAPVAPPTDIPSFVARLIGLEEGDPFEGMEVEGPSAPDFDALAGNLPDEVLTDPAALRKAIAASNKAVYDAALAAADARTRSLVTKVSEKSYAPLRDQRIQAAREASAADVESRVRTLPGMKNDAAFDTVVDLMNEVGLNGEEAFRRVHARLAPLHPEWAAPPAPVAPNASAAPPAPVVVTRPAPKPESPFDALQQLSARTNPSTAPGRTGNIIPANQGRAAEGRALAQDPAVRSALANKDGRPSWERVRDPIRRALGETT
jgi:hypothetical protein